MVGLIVKDKEAYIHTPDHDLYVEKLSCKGGRTDPVKFRALGPRLTLPRNFLAQAYRFRGGLDDAVIRQAITDPIALAKRQYGSDLELPLKVVDTKGERKTYDVFFGVPVSHHLERELARRMLRLCNLPWLIVCWYRRSLWVDWCWAKRFP